MKTTQCKVGVKYLGLAGIGGFYKGLGLNMCLLLIPIQAILDADCKVGSVHAFLNSAKGKICIKKSTYISIEGPSWVFVPYGFYVVAVTTTLWEELLKISRKGGDYNLEKFSGGPNKKKFFHFPCREAGKKQSF